MNTKLAQLLLAAASAAAVGAVVAVSASAGAVTTTMITGADIKNGSALSVDIKDKSVTGKDVKDGALTVSDLSAATVAGFGSTSGQPGPPGAAGSAGAAGSEGPIGPIGSIGSSGAPGTIGLQLVEKTFAVASGSNVNLVITCPGGTKMLGIAADWIDSVAPTATKFTNSTTGVARAKNTTDSTKTMRVTATCAVVS